METSTPNSKKDTERKIIAGALTRIGFAESRISLRERPDAIVELSRGSARLDVAIELQALSSDDSASGSALQRFRGRWQTALRSAARAIGCEVGELPACVAQFRTSTYECLDGIPQAELVTELTRAAQALASRTNINFPSDEFPLLSTVLTQLRVTEDKWSGPRWWPSHLQSGNVPNMSAAVETAIRSKIALAHDYNWQGANERWLLLVANAEGLTDIIGGPSRLARPTIVDCAPFTAVMVWDRTFDDLWQLLPELAVICAAHEQRRNQQSVPAAARPFIVRDDSYPTRPKSR